MERSFTRYRSFFLLIVLAVLALGSCRDGFNDPTPVATRMQIVSGSNQIIDGVRVFNDPFIVRVLDQNGNAVVNQPVEWKIMSGVAEFVGPPRTSTLATGDTQQELRALRPGVIEIQAAVEDSPALVQGSPVGFRVEAFPALETSIVMESFIRGRRENLQGGKNIVCSDVPVSVSVAGGPSDARIEWVGGRVAYSGRNVVNFFREIDLDAVGASQFWGRSGLATGESLTTRHTFEAHTPFLVIFRFDYRVSYAEEVRTVTFNAFNCGGVLTRD